MSAGAVTLLNVAKPKIFNGTIQLASHSFKICLTSAALAFSAGYTGTSGNAKYSDISASEVTGTGYTAGGAATTVAVTGTSTVTATCTGATWATSTISAVYAVIYDDTAANKDILCYMPLDSGLASVSDTNGTYTVTFSTGIFSIT